MNLKDALITLRNLAKQYEVPLRSSQEFQEKTQIFNALLTGIKGIDYMCDHASMYDPDYLGICYNCNQPALDHDYDTELCNPDSLDNNDD